MENEMEIQDSLTPDEPQDSTPEQPEEIEVPSEVIEQITKAQELANNYKIRAEKAEQALKKAKTAEKEVKTESINGLSLKAIRALQNVHDEDVEAVEKWSKTQGIPIEEAVKDPVMQTYFRTRAEERASAQAINVGTQRKSTKTNSDDEILNNFSRGVLPETDEDIRRLAEAQMRARKAANKTR